jgi:hypothetical protein
MNTPTYHNLKRRPAKPALNRGRLRRGALRALWAHDRPITTGEAMEYAHCMRLHRGEPIRSIHYHRLRQALDRVADRVGHGLGSGRPWLWRLRD